MVEEIPFDSLDNWYFEQETKNLRHSSGKFFSIEGINVNTNFGPRQSGSAIIIQPEIGNLELLRKNSTGSAIFLCRLRWNPEILILFSYLRLDRLQGATIQKFIMADCHCIWNILPAVQNP